MTRSKSALLSALTVAVVMSGRAGGQSVGVSRPGARGTISGAGIRYPRASSGAGATPQATTVQGSLKGPVGDRVITNGPLTRANGESRFVEVDDVLLLLSGAPSCARLTILAAALPRLADVQRFDELVAIFAGDASQQRAAQALVDQSQ